MSMRMKVPRRSNARRTQVARVACRPSLYFPPFSSLVYLSPRSQLSLLICICSCLFLLQLLFDPFPPSKNPSSANTTNIQLSFPSYFVSLLIFLLISHVSSNEPFLWEHGLTFNWICLIRTSRPSSDTRSKCDSIVLRNLLSHVIFNLCHNFPTE